MRRAFSAATIVAALALAVAACGGGDGGTAAPAPSAAADPLKISGEITWWDTVRTHNEAPTFQALIKEFQAKYPNIKVELRQRPVLGPGPEQVQDRGAGRHRRART